MRLGAQEGGGGAHVLRFRWRVPRESRLPAALTSQQGTSNVGPGSPPRWCSGFEELVSMEAGGISASRVRFHLLMSSAE